MPTVLSNAQKRYLRGLAHALKPVLLVGAKGVTPSLLAELGDVLEQHELVKVKVAAEDREARDAGTGWRCGRCDRPGRRRLDKPLVILPRG